MRTKSVILNFLTDALPQILIGVVGFFKIKVFVKLLGADQLGLYQVYAQVISYLVLLEGGVGSALLYRLYKPIKENDQEKINSIMSASKVIFNVIGCAILLVGIVLSFKLDFFVKEVVISNWYMQGTFLLFLVSQAIYYFVIPYRSMFEAKQQRYVPNLVYQITTIVKSIVEMIIVYSGLGLIPMLLSLIICSLISNGILFIIFKKSYKDISFKAKKDYSMLKDVKDLFVNTLGNLLTNNIDIIIISKFLGLKFVPIYSAYNYIVESIKQFVDKIAGATMAGVGDLMVSGKEKAKAVFDEFNNFVFYVAGVICVPVFLVINEFIRTWYDGEIETKKTWAILFSIIFFYQIIRIPLKVFTLSSGKFKEIKKFVILEIIINLGLSLLLVKRMGISGVLMGTVISLLIADFSTKPIVIFKELFQEKPIKYYLKCIGNTAFTVIMTLVLYIIFPKTYSNVWMCLLFGVIAAIINMLIFTGYFYITKQFNFISRFNFKILKKEKEI